MEQFIRDVRQTFADFWPHIFGAMIIIAAIAATVHAVLHKRDTRATIAWVGLIWLSPVVGVALYFTFGVNRIKRRGTMLRSGQTRSEPPGSSHIATADDIERTLGRQNRHMATLIELDGRLTNRPLLSGNKIEPLDGGDVAYPAMLEAIKSAKRSVALMTYIFDNDRVGRMFAEALGAAVSRGVEVRVLIDDVGLRYTFPPITRQLAKANVRVARFLRTFMPAYFAYSNLRNHRKILVVDGRTAFTGGMNIREGEYLKMHPKHQVQDLHFRLTGPIVVQLQEVFAEDWSFSTNEVLQGEQWYPPLEPAGDTLARGIRSGPDEDLGEIQLALTGALSCAHTRVSIVTPYFLPDETLISALNVAAMRGVQVDVVLPEKNNLLTVQWACAGTLWEVLERGCRVWLSPPPFDHTKLMLVDGLWSLIGSGNWDPRSLRLNFEFNVECYDAALATTLNALVDRKLAAARQITLADVNGRSLPLRLRDGVARLLSPYL
ncbi:MAG TPA: cardiolipin synthase [Pirellulales bacterium]|nr:cardiolipin synthase [Pirellulales bacterium]